MSTSRDPAGEPAIRANSITKSLQGRPVLRNVTMACFPGHRYALLGPNGAGKTTTLRVLATLLRPDSGTLTIASNSTESLTVRRAVGYVGESSGLEDRLTVLESLTFAARCYGLVDFAPRLDELATEFSFGEYLATRCGALSKGTRQKVAVARALMHDPPVLVLDEPTANLDIESVLATESVLLSGDVGRRCVIISTHQLDEAARLCDSVIGLVDGAVFIEATVEDISAEAPGAPDFRRGFLACLNRQRIVAGLA